MFKNYYSHNTCSIVDCSILRPICHKNPVNSAVLPASRLQSYFLNLGCFYEDSAYSCWFISVMILPNSSVDLIRSSIEYIVDTAIISLTFVSLRKAFACFFTVSLLPTKEYFSIWYTEGWLYISFNSSVISDGGCSASLAPVSTPTNILITVVNSLLACSSVSATNTLTPAIV